MQNCAIFVSCTLSFFQARGDSNNPKIIPVFPPYLESLLFPVMSYPAEGAESMFKNHIDEVRNYLEGRHRNCYAVYNLSQRSYRNAKFENRVRVDLHEF